MGYKELVKNLIDQIPNSKMYYIVAYPLESAIPEEISNTGGIGRSRGNDQSRKQSAFQGNR